MEQKRSRITVYSVQLVKERNKMVYGRKIDSQPTRCGKLLAMFYGQRLTWRGNLKRTRA